MQFGKYHEFGIYNEKENNMNLENITKLESIKFRKYHEIWKTS